ncbi:MAG: multicopper oxidase domain-containing protein [Bradyrhizobium sp.]|uniref:multicopper oxidase family protein n=1 Tax=Bradyrhizobium sp. TaxID=376 RepID=UPI0025C23712|nr:multicopper oxidase domain-containing protein [Bradyrhizobium sp.]MBI5265343.1 multicopper oxidase domain-containing protein [Bradyrhizobium sp.]
MKPFPVFNRREVMAGLGAAALCPASGVAVPQAPAPLVLEARVGTMTLRSGQPATPVWELSPSTPDNGVRLRRGDRFELSLKNNLKVAAALGWHGLDGAAAAEPLAARRPTAPGGQESLTISMTHAGTLTADLRLLEDGTGLPARPLPLIVGESEPVVVDRDEIILLEDWRLSAEGAAQVPGAAAPDSPPLYTVNGQMMPDLSVRQNERLRLRFINGCHRAVVAIKIEGHEVVVMALDGQPAEPFLARNGALVLAPGGRCDTFIDATGQAGSVSSILLHDGKEARVVARVVTSSEAPLRPSRLPPAPPLPSNGLPEQLDLKGALRVDVALAGAPKDWVRPADFSASAPPAFRVKRGRVVVLALSNRAETTTIFHLHGHHFRVLDRLDDGWKPYWLDTLAIEPGQTQRIAFAASHAGRWLIESFAAAWAAPRLVRWYAVE